MDKNSLKKLLKRMRDGDISIEKTLERLRHLPFEDIGFAKIDHHRELRCGRQEVILCQGKSPEQIADIAERILDNGHLVLGTRADQEDYDAVKARWPHAQYHESARCVVIEEEPIEHKGRVLVVTGGTSDLPVAEEARITAHVMGASVKLISDVGVAGIHRLLGHVDELQKANVIVVVAGMEGALPSVVGGMVARPVIALPTSVGYGASLGGIAPLLTMLNSCASGVSVMNIDNGFGAGYMAAMINDMALSDADPERWEDSDDSA
ncbi:MAG: nickel pincer cofactor biosynthesis protein LarB [Planctomycetota bacterium]